MRIPNAPLETVKTLALSDVRKAVYSAKMENVLLRFSDPASTTAITTATDMPFDVEYSAGSWYMAINKAGAATLSTVNIANPDFNATSPILSISPGPMRSSICNGKFATATWSWPGQPVIKRYTTGGVLSETLATIPETCSYSTTFVKRVEAVIDTGTYVVVAIGCHHYTMRTSTIKFYIVKGTVAKKCSNIIQVPMLDASTTGAPPSAPTSWYGETHWCSYIDAIDNGNGLTIVCNDTLAGRAMEFTWCRGVESEIQMVIPIDPDASDTTFTPTGLAKIGSLYYLSGYFIRPKTDEINDRLNIYLVSKDGWEWSVGERSHLVSIDNMVGQLTYAPGTSTIYYVGITDKNIGKSFPAPARVIDGYGTATDITEKIIGYSLSSATDNADNFDIVVTDPSLLQEGDMVTFNLGYQGTYNNTAIVPTKMGQYLVDQAPVTTTFNGVDVSQVTCVDCAGQIMSDWHSPVDRDSWSTTKHIDDLNDMSNIVFKTPQRDSTVQSAKLNADPNYTQPKDTTVTDGSLYSKSLNDPTVCFTTDRDERDGMAYAEVAYQDTDPHCLQTFAFTFGGTTDTDGNSKFNAATVYKASSWTGHVRTEPELLTSNLKKVATTIEDEIETTTGGFNTTARMTGLVEADADRILADGYTQMLITPTIYGAQEVYRPMTSWTATSGNTNQFVMRKQGSKIQMFAKLKNYAPANCNANATYTLLREFTFNEYSLMGFDTRPYWGIACATDVTANTDWFKQAMYGDLELQLTDATDISDSYSSYTILLKGDGTSGSPGCSRDGQFTIGTDGTMWGIQGSNFTGETPISYFHAGLQLYIPPWGTHRVVWVDTNSKTVKLDLTLEHSGYFDVYALGVTSSWGTADSGYTKTAIPNSTNYFYTDPGATMTNTLIGGKACFITDDQTAFSNRYVETNGTYHILRSGNEDAQKGWDPVTPVTVPSSWRCLLHHGRFFVGKAQNYGLPQFGYFKVEDEIMRYRDTLFYKPGDSLQHLPANQVWWCEVPTYYSSIHAIAANSKTLTAWAIANNPSKNRTFGQIEADLGSPTQTGVVGTTMFVKDMLVELTNRSSTADVSTTDTTVEDTAYHVDFTTDNGTTVDSSLTMDNAYPSAIAEPVQYGTDGAAAIVSGRGQLTTVKTTHSPTSPVVFYPIKFPTNTVPSEAFKWLIKVDCFDHYQGNYNSVQDDLTRICLMAGIRDVQFRGMSPNDTTSYTGTLTTTATRVNSVAISDFVLDMKAHLYGYQDNWLRTTFRSGNYFLDMKTGTYDGTAHKCIRLRLSAPLSTITTSDGIKRLEEVSIPVSQWDLSGETAEDTSIALPIRIVVKQNLIMVEINNHPLWTFNLDRYTYLNGATSMNYKVLTAGVVDVNYVAAGSAPITMICQEMSSEVENHIVDMDSTGSDAVGFVLTDRHIWTRSTQDGGISYSQYMTRDDWSSDGVSLTETVTKDVDTKSNWSVAGHAVVSGADFGEYIDLPWIRQHGYSFVMGENKLLNTPQDSRVEAKLQVRLGKEQVDKRSLDTAIFPEMQPADRFDLEHPAIGGIPALAKTGYVVEQISISGDMNGGTCSIGARIEST